MQFALGTLLQKPSRAERSGVRKSRWPARLDILQSVSGLFLCLFLIAHMAFMTSILISHEAFYQVARFFEGVWLLGKPYPIIVSAVAALVAGAVVLHAWLAMRKFPANFRQYRNFSLHQKRLRHVETHLWWVQVWTGFALFFLVAIHLHQMMTQPELIGPYASADRVWSGNLWPLYLILLVVVQVHAGIGLYRLMIKWGWFDDKTAARSRRRLRNVVLLFYGFSIALGIVTISAHISLGRAHADKAGERYVPPPSIGSEAR